MPGVDEADPIWGEVPADVRPWQGDGREVMSPRAGGRYRITGSALAVLRGLSPLQRAKLTRWIVDSNRIQGEPPEVTTEILNRACSLPELTVAQRMDRLLAHLANSGVRPGVRLTWLGTHQVTPETVRARMEALAVLDAIDESELPAFRGLLEDAGLLRNDSNSPSITAAGYARMDELRRGVIPTNQVFVAMWFSAPMSEVYDTAIAPAVMATGFSPLRIDRKEHDNRIDDEILAEIRRSRLLVCDFTSGTVKLEGKTITIPRGGVYYEAGFAQGLGIPVVWCVREDQIGDVHFDTRQFNHIVWKDAEDLRRRLINRIRARFDDAV